MNKHSAPETTETITDMFQVVRYSRMHAEEGTWTVVEAGDLLSFGNQPPEAGPATTATLSTHVSSADGTLIVLATSSASSSVPVLVASAAAPTIAVSETSNTVAMERVAIVGSSLSVVRRDAVVGFKYQASSNPTTTPGNANKTPKKKREKDKSKNRFQLTFGSVALAQACVAALARVGAKTRTLDPSATSRPGTPVLQDIGAGLVETIQGSLETKKRPALSSGIETRPHDSQPFMMNDSQIFQSQVNDWFPENFKQPPCSNSVLPQVSSSLSDSALSGKSLSTQTSNQPNSITRNNHGTNSNSQPFTEPEYNANPDSDSYETKLPPDIGFLSTPTVRPSPSTKTPPVASQSLMPNPEILEGLIPGTRSNAAGAIQELPILLKQHDNHRTVSHIPNEFPQDLTFDEMTNEEQQKVLAEVLRDPQFLSILRAAEKCVVERMILD
ncbi:hypothetical protein BC830DRAFT_10 [Chytriomyces sp. MP71]|nr:hypothetical protein BC830DRAFT_10 [Chytriomyces sp. MP71]